MGAVHLSVADLDRSVAYYEQLGLQTDTNGTLSTGGEPLLHLTEEPGAKPADGFAGLFHFALLVPDRAVLGAWLRDNRLQLTGLSDHAVSEAVYLRDPDGHGIEIYADRPREQWEGRVAELMTTVHLDTRDLLAAAGDAPFTATMGHVHLRATEVEQTAVFYNELGFDTMARYGPQAVFLGHDGYHHHIGANVWESAGRPQAPEGYATLKAFEILGAGRDEEVTDPSGLTVRLRSTP